MSTLDNKTVDRTSPAFTEVSVHDLETMTAEAVNQLPYGVIGLAQDGLTERYNATEERLAGIPSEMVLGMPFFLSVAQCMNNFMVAHRMETEEELDVVLPYTLTFRMRPTPVILRLLKKAAYPRSYVLIQR